MARPWYWNATLVCGCEIRGTGWPTPDIGEMFVCIDHGPSGVAEAGGQGWRTYG